MDVDFCIDKHAADGLQGWAWCPADPELPLSIEIVDKAGRSMVHALADLFREDLAGEGKRGGWCGFAIGIDARWPSGQYQLRVRRQGETATIGEPFDHDGPPSQEDNAPGPLIGFMDGIRNGEIVGWACRPDRPDETIRIEICIDGIVAATVEAEEYRSDLRIAGFGHGRHGWRARLPRIPARQVVQITVRERGGAPLANGVLEYPYRPTSEDLASPEIRAFIDAVFSDQPRPRPHSDAEVPSTTHILIHAPAALDNPQVGNDRRGLLRAAGLFRPLLERVGRVHDMADPHGWQVDALIDEALARGESCIMLSFAPLHLTPLALRCPVVPVIAWPYPTLSEGAPGGDHRHDGRHVLRQCGRAIALSGHAAQAVRAALGADFPIATILPPLPPHLPKVPARRAGAPSFILAAAIVADTRGRSFDLLAELPPPPPADFTTTPVTVTLDGTIFATVQSPHEDDKYWLDIASAFVAAHRDHADATLAVRMMDVDPESWWWDFHETMARQPAFSCRIVILQGGIDEDEPLAAVAHWIVQASPAEALCLPLQAFMAGGCPAVAARHSATADYVDPANALIVAATEEYGSWRDDMSEALITTRHRVDWGSLRDALSQGYCEVRDEPEGYQVRAEAAQRMLRQSCDDDVVSTRLDGFLGLGLGLAMAVEPPSPLLSEARAV